MSASKEKEDARKFFRARRDELFDGTVGKALYKTEQQFQIGHILKSLTHRPNLNFLKQISFRHAGNPLRNYSLFSSNIFTDNLVDEIESTWSKSTKIRNSLDELDQSKNKYLRPNKYFRELVENDINYCLSQNGKLQSLIESARQNPKVRCSKGDVLRVLPDRLAEYINQLASEYDREQDHYLEEVMLRLLKCHLLITDDSSSPIEWNRRARSVCEGPGLSVPMVPRRIMQTGPNWTFKIGAVRGEDEQSHPRLIPDKFQTEDWRRVETTLPIAKNVADVVSKIFDGEGYLSSLVRTDRSVHEMFDSKYRNLPDLFGIIGSRIIAPKAAKFRQFRRRHRKTMHFGLAGAALSVLAEGALRQIAQELEIGDYSKDSPVELMGLITDRLDTSRQLDEDFSRVFGGGMISIRDKFCHGMFIGSDERLRTQCRILLRLVLGISKEFPSCFDDTEPWWRRARLRLDASNSMLSRMAAFSTIGPRSDAERQVAQQMVGGLHLISQDEILELQTRYLNVIRQLDPEHWLLGHTAVGLWILGLSVRQCGPRDDLGWKKYAFRRGDYTPTSEDSESADFAALLGNTIVFENLLRGAFIKNDLRVLQVNKEHNENVFELDILNSYGLLDSGNVERIVGEGIYLEIQEPLKVAKAFRDRIMHGGLHSLDCSCDEISHFFLKLSLSVAGALTEKGASIELDRFSA